MRVNKKQINFTLTTVQFFTVTLLVAFSLQIAISVTRLLKSRINVEVNLILFMITFIERKKGKKELCSNMACTLQQNCKAECYRNSNSSDY